VAKESVPQDAAVISPCIAELPEGFISSKTTKGKVQPCLQQADTGRTRNHAPKVRNQNTVISQVEESEHPNPQLAVLSP